MHDRETSLLPISCMHLLELSGCCTSPLHSRQAEFPRTSLCIVLAKPLSHIPGYGLKGAPHPSLPDLSWLLHSWARWPRGGTVSSRMAGGSGDPGCPGCLLSPGIAGDPLPSLRRHHPNPLLPLLPGDHRFGGAGNKSPPTQNSWLSKKWS